MYDMHRQQSQFFPGQDYQNYGWHQEYERRIARLERRTQRQAQRIRRLNRRVERIERYLNL